MSPPVGPIYASTLHRRDRAWRRARRRGQARARLALWGGTLVAVAVAVTLHFG